MKITPWLQQFRQLVRQSSQSSRRRNGQVAHSHAVEALEDRALLATFTVSNLNDAGAGSLRQAVLDANAAGGTDTIDATGVAGTIVLTTGQLGLTEGVDIEGPGADRLTISGNDSSTVFEISQGGSYTIADVTIADGNNTSGAGGGVRIANPGAVVDLDRLGFEGNFGNDGGAVHIGGATVQIRESTFVDNSSEFGGSAVSILQEANVWILNSTFSGNESATNRGVIDQLVGNGQTSIARLRNVTIANNTGNAVENIAFPGGTGTFEISNSILANNTAGSIQNSGAGTSTISSRGNNIADDSPSDLNGSFDRVNTDPMIGPLADNGGPLRTHALLAGSPAIEQGSNDSAIDSFAVTFVNDNRLGPFRRIYDANHNGLATIDVGAFEYYGDLRVDTDTDVVDENHGVNQFSLREAVAVANAQPGADTISFASGLGEITLQNGELRATESVSINGPGASSLTISGDDSSRIFRFDAGTTASISDLTLADGNADALGGGAILTFADQLTVSGSVIADNQTTGSGGGIDGDTFTGRIIIDSSTFRNNQGTTANSSDGGAIDNQGPLTITNSTFIDNIAGDQGGALWTSQDAEIIGSTFTGNEATGSGGALYNEGGTLTVDSSVFTGNGRLNVDGGAIHTEEGTTTVVTNSTFSDNVAQSGGAIFNDSADITVINSTLSGNTALAFGGGIWNLTGGAVQVTNSTIAFNRADSNGSGNGVGGAFSSFNSPANFDNTLVIGNVSGPVGSDTPDDITADAGAALNVAASSNNLVGHSGSAGGLSNGTNGNIVGAAVANVLNPALADNGGPTLTHALVSGSPTIDAGSNAALDLLVKPRSVVSSTVSSDFIPASRLLANSNLTLANYETTTDGGHTSGWITDDPNGSTGDYFANGTPAPVLTFDLGQQMSLTDVVVWGGGGNNNNDVKSFEIELSTDGGLSFASAISMTKPRFSFSDFVHTLPLGETFEANFVRITITDNYFGEPGQGGGDRVAFNEIRFLGQPATDQRGFLRTVDNVDIGAVEVPFAGDLIVSTATDVVDGDYSNGELSLREVVIAANQRAGADTITFASAMANQQIQLELGELLISEDVSIQGLGSSETVIVARDIASATDNSRLIHVTADGGDVTLDGLTLAAGKVGAGENGGGILFESMGTLTVSNAVISGNEAESQNGGGIYSSGGAVVVTDSEIVGNTASGTGGGIASLGDVTVADSRISGNRSFATSISLGGGGIYVAGSGQVTVTGSEVSSNTSAGEGGGIRLFNTSGSVTVDSTTISGNSAAFGGGVSADSASILNSTLNNNDAEFDGGALFTFDGVVSIVNTTISGNVAGVEGVTESLGGGVFANISEVSIVNSTITLNEATEVGGGVYLGSNRLTAVNSIFANNTDEDGEAPDLRVLAASVTFSLIGDNAGTDLAESPTPDVNTRNIVGSAEGAGIISAGLGPLQDNGGPTLTHALLLGSPAIDAGSSALALDADSNALANDQRGVGFARQIDGNLDSTVTVDIGAFEFTAPVLTVAVTADSISENGGSTTATVSRTGDTSAELTVTLSNDDSTEADVPATVVIAAGQTTSPVFNISAVDDTVVDGTQTATITASANGVASGTDTVDVTDDESASLTVSIVAASVAEGGSTTGTVSRNGDTSAALTVTLSSDDTSEATVPGTVTIAAGETVSPAFTITAADDSDVDGTQTATITASANGLISGTDTVDVTDNDVAPSNQQNVSSDSASKSVVPGGTISVPVIYRTLGENGTPVALQASLLSFNLHFDSSALTFVESTDFFAEGIQVVPNSTRLESDATVTGDDNNSATDLVLVASYTDTDSALNLGWPNNTVVDGQVLYVAHFRAADDFSGTTVNFSANAVGTVIGESEDFAFSSESVTVGVSQNVGNVDGDDDFDANDAFLIQLVQLAGSNTQIDQSKGASSLTAAQIRANIAAIGLAGDVDGDNDFDANDSFLIQLVKLAGSDTQIDQSKGASSLSAAQIRANVDSLGGGSAGQQATASLAPQLAAVTAASEQDRLDLFAHASNRSSNAQYSAPSADVAETDEVWTDFRSWIDAL